MMDDFLEAFKEEAYELLADLETSLLELENNPNDMNLVNQIFRAMHTIKGSSAMAGLDDVSGFTHDAETVLDAVRKNEISVTKELVDITLLARDVIKSLIFDSDADFDKVKEISDSLKGLLQRPEPAGLTKPLKAEVPEQEEEGLLVTYRIHFKPAPSIWHDGLDPIPIIDELRTLGDCSVVARTDTIPFLKELDTESCCFFWDMILTTHKGMNAIKDVFIFLEDRSDLAIDIIDHENLPMDEDGYKKFGEILVERGEVSAEEIKNALDSQKRVGEILVEEKAVSPDAMKSALAEQQHVRKQQKVRKEEARGLSIKVPSERLDSLVNLVGELVTVQARLSRKAAFIKDSELQSISEAVEHLSAELRDNTMNIRLLPIGATFARFNRLFRDLSSELGKEIQLVTEGGETELDKTVIERLGDPMLHLLRNSIDHGIEMPDVREASGKPQTGTIRLAAVHKGAEVVITIEDDGAGLDPDVIRAKAVERGLITADARLAENEILELIFAPGFSTAEKVTDVSGRGVGMDVVKRGIETLRGTIAIESKKGAWTRISLKLPLTLAIIDGLLVRIGEELFVIPVPAVEECVELDQDEAARAAKLEIMDLRGKIVPYLRLRELFEIDVEPPSLERVVIVEAKNGAKMGLGVDQVVGQHQTVIKSLGGLYTDVEGISGATILGDGTVALILDIPMLVQSAEKVAQS
ncbi:MAG: chemotaxis protein CheA [Desulfobulbaceae bacterium]|nr:chemotaxis protein CheA [Desulfobulbaceae bacterium]